MKPDSQKRTLESRDSHLKPSPTHQEREGTALLIPSLYSSPVSPEKSEWFFHFQGAVLDNEALIKTCLPERNNGEVETQMETGGSVVHFAAAFSKLSKRRVK